MLSNAIDSSNLKRLLEDGLLWFAEENSSDLIKKLSIQSLFHPTTKEKVSNRSSVPFGIKQIDQALPCFGLKRGAVHQFCYKQNLKSSPPCALLGLLAESALKDLSKDKFIVWIGRSIWPAPFLLKQISDNRDFISKNIFIDPPNKKLLLWTIETTLRSPASAVVITPSPSASIALNKRFSLAAEQSNATGFFLADINKANLISAQTSWSIKPYVSNSNFPNFELALLKHKGAKLKQSAWIIEIGEDKDGKVSMCIPREEQPASTLQSGALGTKIYASGGIR